MRLALLRHADAARAAGLVRDDWDRPLTTVGRDQARRSAEVLRTAGVRIDRLFTSPLMRAVQTAEIVAAVLPFTGPVEALPLLRKTDAWRTALDPVLDELADGAGKQPAILLVGHNPDLSDLAAELLGLPPGGVQLGTACGCIVDLVQPSVAGGGNLFGFIDPGASELHREP